MTDKQTVQLPEAFIRKMRALLKDEYEAFEKSYETERVQGLRLNTLKGSFEKLLGDCRERFGLTPISWCPEGFYYRADTRPGRHALHEAGVYYIQEPSAMSVVTLLNPQPGDRVLDLCAAPGGKTTHIAERLCGEGLLVSNEIHPARAKILSQNVERMGITNAVVTNEDSGKLKKHFSEFFDKIAVDAPCSGEGMFRKDAEARNQWSEDNVTLCANRQQEILDNAASMLKPGGKLVYSTCTFSPEEDEDGIAAFLERHQEFSVAAADDGVKLDGLSAGHAEWSQRACPKLHDTFRIWPHKAEGEGHYLALLVKAGEASVAEVSGEMDSYAATTKQSGTGKNQGGSGKKNRQRQNPQNSSGDWNDPTGMKLLEESMEQILSHPEHRMSDCRTAEAGVSGTGVSETGMSEAGIAKLVRKRAAGEQGRLLMFGEQIYSLPEGMPSIDGLRVLRPGLHLGTLKKNRFEPSHALALALKPSDVKQSLCLDPESPEIRAYLAGNTLLDDEGRKGWTLICADQYSLGWAKAASGILKNHYPKGLRIL